MKSLHDMAEGQAPASLSLDRLFELAETLGTMMERGMAERGVSRARAGRLWALLHGGPMTQRALAARLGVTPRNVTGLLDRPRGRRAGPARGAPPRTAARCWSPSPSTGGR